MNEPWQGVGNGVENRGRFVQPFFGFAKFPVLESRREADGYARHGEERTNLSFLSVLNS